MAAKIWNFMALKKEIYNDYSTYCSTLRFSFGNKGKMLATCL